MSLSGSLFITFAFSEGKEGERKEGEGLSSGLFSSAGRGLSGFFLPQHPWWYKIACSWLRPGFRVRGLPINGRDLLWDEHKLCRTVP